MNTMRTLSCIAALWSVITLAGCSPYVGVGVPVGPFNVGVGIGSGGVSTNIGTGVGPVGVGVGVNSRGQVTGNAGVGVSVPVGGAHVGAGVGASQVLRQPQSSPQAAKPVTHPEGAVQWRDAQGRIVPECRVRGGC